MPNNNGYYENIYIHQNFNKNEIRSVLLENATYNTRPTPTSGSDKGLLYFDTEINRIIVWNGSEWKIVKYFDDRDFSNYEDVQLGDIWAESETISSITEDEAKGLTGSQSAVQYFENEVLMNIPGSWSYYTAKMVDVIFPREFSTGASYSTFYEPIVKNNSGTTIPSSNYVINQYNVSGKLQYRIEFKDGRIMNNLGVNPTNLPTITFYKYVGSKVSLNLLDGVVNKFVFDGSDFSVDPNDSDRYRRTLSGTSIKDRSSIASLSINGQEIPFNFYTVYQDDLDNMYYVSIDISDTGTDWVSEGGLDSDDLILVNSLISI